MAKKLAPFSALQKAKDYIDSKLNAKVDKVSGKGLSTNDYTTTEKNKLSGIASGAEVNVQSDWNQSTTTADDYIKNKPSSLPASDVYAWAKASTKPSYSASEVGAIASTTKGAANGVAELDSAGKVPSSQLPSYVDDVLEYNSKSAFPSTGEAGKIYVDKTTELTWRWSGSAYVEISPSLALGETSSTAYRGDRGKTAYDHSQSTHARTDATAVSASSTNGNIKINGTETTVYTHPGSGTNPHGTTKSDVGLGLVGNFKAVSTVANQGLSTTEKQNARNNLDIHVGQYSASTVDAIYTNLVKGKGVFFGSTELSADPVLTNTWYNFQWIPHRDGTAEGDNSNFGNFIFYSMVSASKVYVVRFTNGRRAETIEIPKKTDIPTVNNAILTIQKNGNNVQAFSANQASNVTANIIAAENATLSSQNLNDVVIPGFYNADGGNTVTNKPSGIDAFGLEVIHSAGGKYYTQIIYSNTSAVSYRRNCNNGTWGSWVLDKLTDTTYSDATTSTSGLMSSSDKTKLNGIASGAEANVQPDWNQSTTTADDYIKNKPSSLPASDVYPWAKASTKPSYSASEVGLGNVGNFKAVSTVANQGLSDTEKANARDNIGAASDSLATTSVKGLMSPDDKNTLNVLNARHKIRVITAQNSYNSSTGKSTVTFTLNPNNLDGYGKFYRVSSMDSAGFGCMFTFHCFAGGLNISSDKLTPNCTMTTSGTPTTGLAVTLVSTEGVGYSGQFRVKIETINY